MAVLTICAIVAGAVLVVAGAASAITYYATEEDRARARIAEIDQQISNCETVINSFSNLKTKLNNGKSYLEAGKTDFANGGHVLEDKPLANTEFNNCINKINNSITDIDKIIRKYNEQISELRQERAEQEAKLD